MKNLVIIPLIMSVLPLSGQDSAIVITKIFRFADGVYLSFQEFRQNKPSYRLAEVKPSYFTNPQTSLTQVDSVFILEEKRYLDLDSVWAIAIEGIPSVRLGKNEINRELPTFAALKVRGKICYFTFPDFRVKKIQVAAYNPLTGVPFRKGTVEREEEVFIEKMLHFETGEVLDFTVPNFLSWIHDDPLLVATIQELPPEEQQKKLFKCLLIYDDRMPVLIGRY